MIFTVKKKKERISWERVVCWIGFLNQTLICVKIRTV